MNLKLITVISIIIAISYQKTAMGLPDYCKLASNGGDYSREYKNVSFEVSGPHISFKQINGLANGTIDSATINDSAKKVGVVFAFLVLAFLSFICFLCFCCCCNRYSSAGTGKQKILTICALVCVTTFVVLMIINSVKVFWFPIEISNVSCSLIEFTTVLVDGSPLEEPPFRGFQKLSNIISSLITDISGFSSFQSELSSASNSNVKDLTASAITSLENFKTSKLPNYKSWDSSNSSKKTIFITTMESDGINAIKNEFTFLDEAATGIIAGVKAGAKIASDFQISSTAITDSLNAIVTKINDIITNINDFGTNIEKTANEIYKNRKLIVTGFGLFIGLLLVFTGLISVCLLIGCLRGKDCCRCCIKLVMVIGAFFLILYGFLTIVFFVISVISNTACVGISDILSSTDINQTLLDLGVEVPASLDGFVTNCLSSTATGDLSSFLPNTDGLMGNTENLFTSFKMMDDVKLKLDKANGNSVTIKEAVSTANKFEDGIQPDHQEVIASLSTLNGLVSCDGKSIALTTAGCNGDSNCVGVTESSYSVPSCSSDTTQAGNLVTNLKKYMTEEKTMISNFKTDLSTGSGSPGDKAKIVYTEFQTILTNLNTTKDSLQNTINKASNGLDFKKNYNCLVLRQQIINISSNLCEGLGNSLHNLVVILIVFLYITLLSKKSLRLKFLKMISLRD